MATAAGEGPTGSAISFVDQGWGFFEAKAIEFSYQATNLINNLANIPQLAVTPFSVSFPDVAGLTGFVRPDRPTLPSVEFTAPAIPEAPDVSAPPTPAFTEAPAFDVEAPPTIVLPAQPGALNVAGPGAAPVVGDITIPAAPDYVLPALPAFFDIVVPSLGPLNFSTFSGTDPGEAPGLPDLSSAGFTEQAYTPKVLDDVATKVASALNSGMLLATPIEAAIFQRGRERIDRAGAKARQQIAEEFSGRGYLAPPGAMFGAMIEVEQKNQDSINDANRDQTIKLHQDAVENVKFAIVQGIALEQILIGQHSAIMDRAVQAAKLMLDTHVALYNASVAAYNAKIERFKADAAVFEAVIRAEIQRVEAFKAEVEAQKAVAGINQAMADAHSAQVRGVVGLSELYNSTVAAAKAQAEIELTKVEAYKATVLAYGEQVKAKSVEWDGYVAATNAQSNLFRSYEIGVNAFAARTNAWAEGERAKNSRYETDVRAAGLKLEAFKTRVQQVLAVLQAEEVRISAAVAQIEGLSKMYVADGTIAAAESDANTRAFQAVLAYTEAKSASELAVGQTRIQNAIAVMQSKVAAISGAASAMTQLCSSAFSGVNFNAGVNASGSESSSWSQSWSKSLGWSWQGETADASAPSW